MNGVTTSLADGFAVVIDRGSGADRWLEKEALKALVKDHGVVICRGLATTADQFLTFAHSVMDTPMIFGGNRPTLAENRRVQATDAGTHAIPPHCENAFVPARPDLAFFCCRVRANAGGQTTVVDGIRAFEEMSAAVRQVLIERKFTYHCSYPPIMWQRMFPAAGRREMNQLLDHIATRGRELDFGFDYTLEADGVLSYRYTTTAVFAEPRSGRLAYADSATLYAGPAPLGRPEHAEIKWTTMDDDSAIPAEVCVEAARALDKHTIELDWSPGDVVVVDNWRALHGRRAFTDPSRVVAALFGYAAWNCRRSVMPATFVRGR